MTNTPTLTGAVPGALKTIGLALRAARESPRVFSVWVDPKFQSVPHIQDSIALICSQEPRTIISIPPSHGKSRISLEAAAWLILSQSGLRVTLASWDEDRIIDSARTIRDRIAQSPRSKMVFPLVNLPPKAQQIKSFKLSNGSVLSTVRVGDDISTTDVLIIDDPIRNHADAASAVVRSKVWDWYINAAYTRLTPSGRIALICSRTHAEDLAGRLSDQGQWKTIAYRAISEQGDALWPDRIPADYLRKTEAAIGGPAWRAMYLSLPDKADGSGSMVMPRRESFREFLEMDAMVPGSTASRDTRGTFQRFTFNGREALLGIVECIDRILSEGRKDATLALAGGAQYGKTVIQHAFMGYATGQMFRNVMTFLPSEDLVSDIVQTKFRPNVVDQMPWFAGMLKMGQLTNESGKTVNRIGVYSVTDGIRKSTGMFCGLNKVPTTHTADIALVDEVDDVNSSNEKFVAGRLTTSDLRFIFKAGTQRVHGRGMNKAWRDGSQGVVEFHCTQCGHTQNPEDNFPKIVCLREEDATEPARLTHAGDFRRGDEIVSGYSKSNSYFLGCVRCGCELDRQDPKWKHRREDQIEIDNWSFRVSQLSIAAIDLGKIVNDWRLALEHEDKMLMFRTDVLAIPRSTAQKLEPEIMDRARRIEVFEPGYPLHPNNTRFAGLDMGGRCWYVVREIQSTTSKRIVWAESIPLHQVAIRVPQLSESLGVSSTFIDQMPETKESRTLALRLNGFDTLAQWPRIPDKGPCHVTFPGGIAFVRDDSGNESWKGLRAAVVRFDKKKQGQGIEQTVDLFTGSTGQQICVPMILCNRYESVDSVVREFLTPQEGEIENHPGTGIRQVPSMRLPMSHLDIYREFDEHHISGSERDRNDSNDLGDYVDGIPNHLLFANCYSRLAEVIGGHSKRQPLQTGRIERAPRVSGI